MSNRTTAKGYWRAHGDVRRTGAPAVMPSVMHITGIDATLAATTRHKRMPAGVRILRVGIRGGGTGGTAPLLDVGYEAWDEGTSQWLGVPNAFVDGAPVDSDSSVDVASVTANANMSGLYTTSYVITTSDGGGINATGGTFELFIWYIHEDDGRMND